MKAGTAELQGWLSQHPALYRWQGTVVFYQCKARSSVVVYPGPSASGAGEAHFFDKLASDDDLESRWLDNYLWKGLTIPPHGPMLRNLYTFEKTPGYMNMGPVQIERMARMIPSARLVAALREPASRMYSHFQHRYVAPIWL
jgi:hypothetical protein